MMAVQKSRKSRASSRMKRRLVFKVLSIRKDKLSGEWYLSHNLSKKGYYRGRKII